MRKLQNAFWGAVALVLTAVPGASFAAGTVPNCYRITVNTQDVSGAGTDANITATFANASGGSASWVLNPNMSGNAFERGAVDSAVYCTDVALGVPSSLTIYSDGYASGSAWDVDTITIQPEGIDDPSLMAVFPFGQTLDDEQTLSANNVLPGNDNWDMLTVTIRTGQQGGSGTDANVWLTVTGPQGITEKTRLTSYISGDAFERGDTDMVRLFVPYRIGKPSEIMLEIEGAYAGNDWYVTDVVITDRAGAESKFTINKILTADAVDPTLQNTFRVDVPRRILTVAEGDPLPDIWDRTQEIQIHDNLGNTESRSVDLEFIQTVENSIEIMNGNNDSKSQSVSVMVRAGNDNTPAAAEVTGGIEFSQEVQTEITKGLSYVVENSTTQNFTIPADHILFVECTWSVPQHQIRVTDKNEDFVLRVIKDKPQFNCGTEQIGPDDDFTTEYQTLAQERLDAATWKSLKRRAQKAGIILE